jgi:peptidoglycan/LPS O-acetylase OafA/YrhL
VLYLVRVLAWKDAGVNFVTGIESSCWMFAIFGFASRHLNRPSRSLVYLSGAVYTVYIVHMPVQFALAYFLIPTGLPAAAKLILLTIGTFAGSFALYEILKRLNWIRPLFGMKFQRRMRGMEPPLKSNTPDAALCNTIPNKETSA